MELVIPGRGAGSRHDRLAAATGVAKTGRPAAGCSPVQPFGPQRPAGSWAGSRRIPRWAVACASAGCHPHRSGDRSTWALWQSVVCVDRVLMP